MDKVNVLRPVEDIRSIIVDFLAENPTGVVKQGGTSLFALDSVSFEVSTEYRRCTVCFWADFLNLRRTVVDAEVVKRCLRLNITRLGTNKHEILWVTPDEATHAYTSVDLARLRYADLLRRTQQKQLIENGDAFLPDRQTTLIKLEKTGLYLRGMVRQGAERWALVGISRYERLENIQSLLRYGLAWLVKCRASANGRPVAGLKVFCPQGRSSRMEHQIAWFARPEEIELYELDEEHEEVTRFYPDRTASCLPYVVRTFNAESLADHCRESVAELDSLLPPGASEKIDLQALSPSLLSVRLRGLEFASIVYGPEADSFRRSTTLYRSVGRKRVLLAGAEAKRRFELQMVTLFEQRDADAVRTTPLYRNAADAWLAKVIRDAITELEPRIRPEAIYRSVECSSDGTADSIDLLAIANTGQLIIVHIRARENTLFPLHGLDQWLRIRELARSGELQKAGYFPNLTISAADPELIFISPALRLREDNEVVLNFLSRQVPWTYIAVDENWRQTSQVIYRKQSERKRLPLAEELPLQTAAELRFPAAEN